MSFAYEDFEKNPNMSKHDQDATQRLYDEIWKGGEYLIHDACICKGDTVVDMGSHIGIFSILAACHGAERVICIEPFDDNFFYLQKNCRKYNQKGKNVLEPIQAFVYGNDKQPRIIQQTINHEGTQRKMVHDLSFPGASIMLQQKGQNMFMNLQDVFERFQLQKIDFLKIDIEGKEHDLLIHAHENLLKRIKQMVVEFHIHSILENKMDDFANFLWIMNKLSHCGFSLKLDRPRPNTNLYTLFAKNEISKSHDFI